MKKIIYTVTTCLAMTVSANVHTNELPERFKTVQHKGFSLVMDCVTRTPVLFQFRLGKDVWNEPRTDNFDFDPQLPAECQQASSQSYGYRNGTLYHRGHLVGANAMDNTRTTMEESFYMSNIVPQASDFNTGAWKLTEEYQECLREESDILVLGGVAFNDEKNDFFMRGHQIKTPDVFWKVIVTGEGYYAWMFSNTDEMTKEVANDYLTSITNIENTIGFTLNLESISRLPGSQLPPDTSKCHLG